MIAVVFHTVDEFLEELDLDSDRSNDRRITRRIVRLSREYVGFMSLAGSARRVYVRASYVSDDRIIGIQRTTQLVELHEHCGVQVGDVDEDAKAEERVEAVSDAIRQACERIGLEVRTGAHRAVA